MLMENRNLELGAPSLTALTPVAAESVRLLKEIVKTEEEKEDKKIGPAP